MQVNYEAGMESEFSIGGVTSASHGTVSAGLLGYLPVGLFGSVMGLMGLSVAWRLAHEHFGASASISHWIGGVAVVVFAVVGFAYGIKAVTAPQAVRAEFAHPIAGNLFATILISMVLLPIVLAPINLILARILWATGALGTMLFAWFVLGRWLGVQQHPVHATPAWLVPVVGILNVPLAMPALQLTHLHGVTVAGLAIGLFFTLPLFTIIISRLIFESRLPDEFQPSLLILMAPFAVGTSTYIVTTGHVDLFAKSLFVLTLFMQTVLLGRLRHLGACCPFRVSWWSVSFPLAASAIAALRIAAASQSTATDVIAILLLGLASVSVALLLMRSLYGVARGQLRTLSG
jgi:tellurite resistance protein